MSICKGCGLNIEWVFTKSGKRTPIDPEPLYLVPDSKGSETAYLANGDLIHGRKPEKGEEKVALKCYRSHFVTCRSRDEFKKASEPGKPKAKYEQMSMF